MNSLNLEVITSVCDWLQQDDFVFFVTVLNTWGASPRPVGSLYAYNPQKKLQFGSLSGGCIEDDLVIKLNTTYAAGSDKPYFVTRYGDNEGDGERYLLPCGGVIELLVESLHGPEAFKHFVMLKANLIAHRRVARYLDFTLSLPYLLSSDDQASNSKDVLLFQKDKETLYHRLDPVYQLLIIGAGDVTTYLARLAEIVEFRVTICEPRKAFLLKQESFSSNLAIKNCLPDDLIHAEFSNNYTAIVCLAHDPKVDDMALIEALSQSKAFYIGAMGSLKTTKNRLDRLKKFGLSEFHLQKLKAPIGINIHSKTPQEIAISILADLISHRHEHKLSLNTRQK